MQNEPHIGFWPELPLVLASFFLNFFWEMMQSPLYEDVYRKAYAEILSSQLHCTLGDVLILVGAYWAIAWMVNNRHWMTQIRARDVIGFTALGLGYTIMSEWVNVDVRSAWGYAATMPRVPWIGTGLTPLIQWITLPPVIAVVAGRFVRGEATYCERLP